MPTSVYTSRSVSAHSHIRLYGQNYRLEIHTQLLSASVQHLSFCECELITCQSETFLFRWHQENWLLTINSCVREYSVLPSFHVQTCGDSMEAKCIKHACAARATSVYVGVASMPVRYCLYFQPQPFHCMLRRQTLVQFRAQFLALSDLSWLLTCRVHNHLSILLHATSPLP